MEGEEGEEGEKGEEDGRKFIVFIDMKGILVMCPIYYSPVC